MRAWLLVFTGCATSFRSYAPPPELPVAAPTSPRDACASPDEIAHEAARERAATDAALRTQHAMLLAPPVITDLGANRQLGSIVRGPEGQRWMIVGRTTPCGGTYAPIGILGQQVFLAHPIFEPREERAMTACHPVMHVEGPRRRVVVEVPEGASFQSVGMSPHVPIDVHVTIDGGWCRP